MLPASEQLAIYSLYAEYNRAIDVGDADAWVATWTDEGVFEHPARRYDGHQELRAFVESRTAGLASHAVSNQRHWNADLVVRADGGQATGGCLLLVAGTHRRSGTAMVVARGRYDDALLRVGGAWRFGRRALVLG
jgi:ketosteroid isomerase-like protein